MVLRNQILRQTGAVDSANRAVFDLSADHSRGTGGGDEIRGGGGEVAEGCVVGVAGAGAIVGLHEAGVVVGADGGDDADAAGRFLHDDGEDKARVDFGGGADGEDRGAQFVGFGLAVEGDVPLGAGGEHVRSVVFEPGMESLARGCVVCKNRLGD